MNSIQSNEQIKAIRFTLISGFVLMAIKFLAYVFTHSNAILTDALESIINVAAACFTYLSLKVSLKPKDKEHPYGHGKIEFISAGFEGGLVLMAAGLIIYESIDSFFHPHEIKRLDWGMILSLFAGAFNYFLGALLIKRGKKNHSPALIADGKHLHTDTWTSVGLVLGLFIVKVTGMVWIDSVMAFGLGIAILITGFQLIRSSLAGLMDEADEALLQQIVDVLEQNRKTNWIDIHNLRLLKYGSHFHIDCHLTLPFYLTLESAHEEVTALEKLLFEKFHAKVEVFVHADPCIESSCAICNFEQCDKRFHAYSSSVKWNLSNVLQNEKHNKFT